jgi:hypothetical protein
MSLQKQRHSEAAPDTHHGSNQAWTTLRLLHAHGWKGFSLNPHDIRGNPRKALMTWLRGDYQQTSFPDIVVVVGHDEKGNTVPCGGRPAIYLLEIKYTEDCNVHAVAQGIAMKPHSRLLAHLQDRWPEWTVEVLPLVFGSVGTVRIQTEQHLETLGLDKQTLMPCCEQCMTAAYVSRCRC